MIKTYEKRLQDHYRRSLKEIRQTGKAPKDVVGKSYEQLRQSVIKEFPNLDIANELETRKFDSLLGDNYKADQYVVCKRTRRLIALEEDKGHYVDKCFAKRALFNAAEVFHHCLKNNIEPPYFILSCPTNHNVDSLLKSKKGFFNEEVFNLLVKNFRFFPLCKHGRTSRKKYLKNEDMPFKLEPALIKKEAEFFNSLNA